MTLRGFPHSEISGSTPVCGSPELIAAVHVLHRLLTPRHPPCALSSLTINPVGTHRASQLATRSMAKVRSSRLTLSDAFAIATRYIDSANLVTRFDLPMTSSRVEHDRDSNRRPHGLQSRRSPS